MTNSQKAREDIEALSAEIFRLEAVAQKENRALTPQEDSLVAEMEGGIRLKTEMLGSEGPLSQPGAHLGGGSHRHGNGRDYQSLFNLSGGLSSGGFKDSTEFLNAIDSGRFDPRLKILASMGENVGSDGGYSVPTQFLSSWLDSSLKSEIARKYARLYPCTSSSMLIPGWDANDFSSGEYAGMKMNFHAEGATATAQDAKMRQVQMSPYQGAIYVNASLELVNDGAGFGEQLQTAMVGAIGHGIDRYCLGAAGSGSGCPQSIINAPCGIKIAGETGQSSGSLQYSNLKKVFSRQLNPDKAMFLFNFSAIPDLLELSVSVGTGGDHVPVLNQGGDGGFTILGRPAIPTSHLPALGTAGSVVFIDWSFYAIAMRATASLDVTDSVRWNQRERSFRVLIRFDAQSTLDGEIVQENGPTLSPIVMLDAI